MVSSRKGTVDWICSRGCRPSPLTAARLKTIKADMDLPLHHLR